MAIRILSIMSWSNMNALFVSDTSLGMIFFRRLAMVLEIILYITLQRLMGQNSFGLKVILFWE